MLTKLLLLAAAGALGTLARFGLSGLVYWLCGSAFPWGTFAVNVLGCFLFGLIYPLAEDDRLLITGEQRLIILTGFMGAFTTFSTLIFETGQHLEGSQWWYAAANLGGQLAIGLGCFFVGQMLGRLL
jgi:CrcB protein